MNINAYKYRGHDVHDALYGNGMFDDAWLGLLLWRTFKKQKRSSDYDGVVYFNGNSYADLDLRRIWTGIWP